MAQTGIDIVSSLSHLKKELVLDIEEASILKVLPRNTEILREGQFIKVIPIVLDGLIKVYTRHDDRELLLYYIQAKESCIMSFSAAIKNSPSQVYAVTEEDSTVVLLPFEKVPGWMKEYPDMNTLFFQQYGQRYKELLDTIHHVLFDRMDKRLHEYLKTKAQVTHQNPIKISHQQIASELGTVREVISRVMKKLENQGVISQQKEGIRIN